MKTYNVTFEIQADAENPREAALMVLNWLQADYNGVWNVQDAVTSEECLIDLDETEEGEEGER